MVQVAQVTYENDTHVVAKYHARSPAVWMAYKQLLVSVWGKALFIR